MAYQHEHPYARPAESDVEMFIQWKGTVLCMDFACQCGVRSHLDGDFAFFVECPVCGALYEMGAQVIAKRVTAEHVDGRITRMLDNG